MADSEEVPVLRSTNLNEDARGGHDDHAASMQVRIDLDVMRRIDNCDGIGGFFDSIMGMMIVTLGIVLLMSTLVIVDGEVSKDSKARMLENACQELLNSLPSEDGLSVSKGTLDYSLIVNMSASEPCIDDNVIGYRMVLRELHAETSPLSVMAKGEIPATLSELYATTVPISVRHSAFDVRAALLYVWVW
jgi:hypothetical protein